MYYNYIIKGGFMLNVRLPENLEHRLANLSTKTGRPKSYYVRQAIQSFLDAEEDYFLALSRLEKNNPRLSLKELEQQLDLED